jgi:hypothetical protein
MLLVFFNPEVTDTADDSCLRSANVPIIGDDDCKRMYSDSHKKISNGNAKVVVVVLLLLFCCCCFVVVVLLLLLF